MAEDKTVVDVEGHQLTLSNLDKLLYPESATTKRDVLTYYTHIAPVMLPHLADRPVTFRRAPDGAAGQVFFEKHVPRGAPKWVRTITVSPSGRRTAKAGGSSRAGRPPSEPIEYPAIDGLPALIWAANLAVLEFHTPMWRADKRHQPKPPDLLVFDLDPGMPATIAQCCEVAQVLRAGLQADGFEPVAKTSGSKGLQLYARIEAGRRSFDSLAYAHELARTLEKEHPAQIVSNMRKELRKNKVLIDWSQNNTAKTTVTPYSLRIGPLPTVSTPVSWDEVAAVADGGDPDQLRFYAEDVLARVEADGDLFEAVARR